MASVQSVHMNYDSFTPSSSGTKRKLDDTAYMRATDAENEVQDAASLADSNPDADGSNEPKGEMSESKRRAQNRAAQRAFRERKERHLKELESRLAQLESESRSWKSTNMALRSQLSLLEDELQHYRRPQGESVPSLPSSAIETQSSGLPAHMISQQQQQPRQYPPSQTPQVPGDQTVRAPDTRSNSSHNGNSPDSMSIPALSFDSPGSASSTTPNRADEFCDKLSLACGTRDRPVPAGAPQIAAESPRWQEDTLLGGVNSDWMRRNSWLASNSFESGMVPDRYGLPGSNTDLPSSTNPLSFNNLHASAKQPSTSDDPLNLDFGILSSGFGGFGFGATPGNKTNEQQPSSGTFPNGNVSGLLNNDFGMFDPLEDMLEWNPGKESVSTSHPSPQSQLSSSRPTHQQAQSQSHIGSQVAPPRTHSQGPSPRSTGHVPAPGPQPVFKVEDQGLSPRDALAMTSMSMGLFGNLPDVGPLAGLEEQVPAASQRFIPCSDVWDRICNHPRFGEIDINSMCQELRSHARCSNTGVVLDEEDVNKVLGTIK